MLEVVAGQPHSDGTLLLSLFVVVFYAWSAVGFIGVIGTYDLAQLYAQINRAPIPVSKVSREVCHCEYVWRSVACPLQPT